LGPIVAQNPNETCPTFSITDSGISDIKMVSVTRTPAFKIQPTITGSGPFAFTDNDNPYTGPPISSDVKAGSVPWTTKTTSCTLLNVCRRRDSISRMHNNFEESQDKITWTPSGTMTISATSPFGGSWQGLTIADTTTSPITIVDPNNQGLHILLKSFHNQSNN
jgi:hypothetical protein